MTRDKTALDRMADRVMDLDSRAYGDERERAVFMESSSFGLTTALYLGLFGAIVSAVLGLVLVPVLLLAMVILPGAAAAWYARRRGVDLQQLAENAGERSTMIALVSFGAGTVLTFGAMSYSVISGDPLLSPPSIDVTFGDGFAGGAAQGALVGGMIGGLAAVAGVVHSYRRASRR
jgi:hypothetical protein